MKIVRIDGRSAESLIKTFEDYQTSTYQPEQDIADTWKYPSGENTSFYGALRGEDTIVAVGAFDIFKNYGEIKQLFVSHQNRGKGLAEKMIRAIEDHLLQLSIRSAKLRIGILQYQALGLYRKLGYKECHAFGAYEPNPNCIFMTKFLK